MCSRSMNDSPGAEPFRGGTVSENGVSLPSDLVLVVDADNTLWDTNEVFAHAQLKFLEVIEQVTGRTSAEADRLGFIRSYDQALASRHHLHLNYPRQMLAATLAAGLNSEPPDSAAESTLQGRPSAHWLSEKLTNEVVAAYSQALTRVPDLLPTVRAGLELARARGLRVFVMTEGKVEAQRQALSTHNLDDLVENVWELPKSVAQFKRLLRRFHPAELVVVGDQPDRDCVPAHEAGCRTVLIPSRFKPHWQSARDKGTADFIAPSFLEAMEWILKYAESVSH